MNKCKLALSGAYPQSDSLPLGCSLKLINHIFSSYYLRWHDLKSIVNIKTQEVTHVRVGSTKIRVFKPVLETRGGGEYQTQETLFCVSLVILTCVAV